MSTGKGKVRSVPVQVWIGPEGSWRLKLSRISDIRHTKVARLLILRTVRLYPQEDLWYSCLLKAESTLSSWCGRYD